MARKAGPSPIDGLIIVDKPQEWTSHDVVGKLRRIVGTRRVGHGGTLDPMATGVLVCGVGKATKLLGLIGATDKSYDATIRLGIATTADDAEGELTSAVDAGYLLESGQQQIHEQEQHCHAREQAEVSDDCDWRGHELLIRGNWGKQVFR